MWWEAATHPFAIALGLALVVVTYLFLFSKAPKKPIIRSQYVGEAEDEKSGPPRRNIEFLDHLIETPDPSVNTLHELFAVAKGKYENKNCYGWRQLIELHHEERKGKTWDLAELKGFEWISYGEAFERAMNVGSGLKHLGLKHGDNLGIFEHTRLGWSLIAHGCFSQNITLVTIYDTLGEESLIHCLKLGDVTHLVTNAQHLGQILKLKDTVPSLKCIIYNDEADQNVLNEFKQKGMELIKFQDMEEEGRKNPSDPAAAKPDDTALIMFTSGSTALPKGVQLTHRNILATIGGVLPVVKDLFNFDEEVYSHYLPLSHILAFVLQYGALFIGIPCGFGNPHTLFDKSVKGCHGDLKELQPTCFVGVPKMFEKMRQVTLDSVRASGFLSMWVFKLLYNYKRWRLNNGFSTPWLDNMFFRKCSDIFGGRIRFMLSGGAPLSPQVQEFTEVCFGVSVLQGYGLTETSGPCTLVTPDHTNRLSVGAPIGSCEIKLVDAEEMGYMHRDTPYPRGEICVRGPSMASCYYKQDDLTKETWTSDGWMMTGDIGIWLSDGTLQVVDRKKNFVKGKHGEFIALEKLESVYKKNEYVEEICVTISGEHDSCVAIVLPVEKKIKGLASMINSSRNFEQLCKNKKIHDHVLGSLQQTGKQYELNEQEMIKNIFLDTEKWSEENGFIGAAMKTQRHKIVKARQEDINKMYEELGE